MKRYFTGFFYSLPVQLLFLHFRRYQILLLFWTILFATISGHFLKPYGADTLMLAPEYLGQVSALSASFVGFAVGAYIMSWNITTFILHSRHIKFLATTSQPFLKFCINNAIIPIVFLLCYFFYAIDYQRTEELSSTLEIFSLTGGFFGGFMLALVLAFGYFFGADRKIFRKMATDFTEANEKYERASRMIKRSRVEKGEMRVDFFLSAMLGLRKPRNVKHYSEDFINSIFKRHHVAAVKAVFFAFICLILIGLFAENHYLQIPAAASITLFFTILIAVAGALSLFLGSWGTPVVLLIYVLVNWMFIQRFIDPRNKAYGLNYETRQVPVYNKDALSVLCNKADVLKDSVAFIKMLNNWKARQTDVKPVMFILDVSGGGNRSAAFTMNVLTRLDTLTGGKFFSQCALITGSSGGMIGAAYFRELYLQKQEGKISSLQQRKYIDNICKDLLNPVFTSLVARDMIGPFGKFTLDGNSFIRDRGYAFEQQLNANTRGILNKRLKDYEQPESEALIPSMIFNTAITRDGRKMLIATKPARFMMQARNRQNNLSQYEIDGVDYQSFFAAQNPGNTRFLTVVRMNATFPFVLPNVELPAKPEIDIMDGGLRDNFGHETSLRFINFFQNWLKENTSKVVLVEIRDRPGENWSRPYQVSSISGLITKPVFVLQNNWFNIQDYYEKDEVNYMLDAYGPSLYKTSFSYEALPNTISASLSFHLTAAEKKGIANSMDNEANQHSFALLDSITDARNK
ncbi:patatin-like phospholipase family protein [Parafilimonas sp.]|uniref:patatin-like phospholipase family protein n=1 Tax=Parafilimonas sp. TaxID=1969739 RepID=UPI0039E49661